AVAAGDQASVDQTSVQWQQGDASGGDQLQAASQSSTTGQGFDPGSLQGYLESSLALGAGAVAQAINKTAQTIVQVQVGCLFYCSDTQQTQQATQSTTAVSLLSQGASAATAPAAAVVGIVDQLVWQLQIGCLAWCSNTTQQQSASQS